MRFQKQLFRHKPDEGIYGDCARTVIACLLDMEPEEVPHEHREMASGEQFEMHERFLRTRGLARIDIPFACDDLDTILTVGEYRSNGMPYVLAGKSRTGVNHVVICQGNKIIWDPSLTDAGIVGPSDDGHFWISWLFRPLEHPQANKGER